MRTKSLTLLSLIPLLLTSCNRGNASFAQVKQLVDAIEDDHTHPVYKVAGSIDLNSTVIEIGDGDGLVFNQNPNGSSYVPYARYNEGFYNDATSDNKVEDPDQVVIYGMASRSYWLRAPLRLHKENFYQELEEGKENPTCGHYQLTHIIAAWLDESGSINASTNKPYYELLSDGWFAIGGNNIRTKVKIDNYPYYLDYAKHPELGEWDEFEPLPCYKTEIDGRFNIRFVYDDQGWLRSEYLATVDYNYNNYTDGQVALRSAYNYRFSAD